MYMRLNGMGDGSNPAPTDYVVPLLTVDAPTPDQLAITSEFPVVTAEAPTVSAALSSSFNLPLVGKVTAKQAIAGLVVLGLLYYLLKRK